MGRGGFPVLAVTALLIALAVHSMVPSALPNFAIANSVNRSLSLTGFIPAWNNTSATPNPQIAVSQGDAITLALSSGDGFPHLFFVDVDHSGSILNCNVDKCSAQFPPSTTFGFTVDFAVGQYKYYCSIHPTTMVGDFSVLSGGTVGGTLIPIDKLSLLAPYIALSALVILGIVAFYVRIPRRGRVERKL